MAGGSLLALLDDIASILDDVATMTKIATRKTAGVLSDDLALNAEQVFGVRASRELPVVWSVAKGSLLNKLILIPAALIIDFFAPWLITLLLMAGGAYLCYEGTEKLIHSYLHKRHHEQATADPALQASNTHDKETTTSEKQKIRGAIRTDFILSAEIIVIALNTVQTQPLLIKTLALLAVGFAITAGVYGIVAGIVKLDDIGYWIVKKNDDPKSILYQVGMVLIKAAPYLMKFLSIVGTIAMFLVGGGIIAHNISSLHHMEEGVAHWISNTPAVGELLSAITPSMLNMLIGLGVGFVVFLVVTQIQQLFKKT